MEENCARERFFFKNTDERRYNSRSRRYSGSFWQYKLHRTDRDAREQQGGMNHNVYRNESARPVCTGLWERKRLGQECEKSSAARFYVLCSPAAAAGLARRSSKA